MQEINQKQIFKYQRIPNHVLCNWARCSQNNKCIKLDYGIRLFDCSPDGNSIALAFYSVSVIKVYNIELGVQIGTDLIGHYDQLSFLRYSRDGNTIVSASELRNIITWDSKTYKCKSTITMQGNEVFDCSPDGKQIITVQYKYGFQESRIRTQCCITGKYLCSIQVKSEYFQIKYSLDAKYLIFSQSSTIHLWDLRRNLSYSQLHAHTRYVTTIEQCENGKLILSGDVLMCIFIWKRNIRKISRKLNPGQIERDVDNYDTQICIKIQNYSLISQIELRLNLWNLTTAKKRSIYHSVPVYYQHKYQLSPDAKFLIIQNKKDTLDVKRLFHANFKKLERI